MTTVQPCYQIDNISLYQGNCLDVLAALPEASVDYVCTDPPYGISFMGKDWDHEVPGPEYWRAVARVCKPGALMLAFGGTRTFHHLTCAIEGAGWEIRDCLMWLYGSGMPKCGDIGKMLDKAKGAERAVIGIDPVRAAKLVHQQGAYTTDAGWSAGHRSADITAPATPEAAQWTGFACALKPAYEPVILAMKPLDGTIAHNALTHGVAGMNIDASRIGTETRYNPPAGNKGGTAALNMGVKGMPKDVSGTVATGRWPANLLLDEEAAALLDAQTGTLKSGTNCVRSKEGHFGEHGGLGKAGDVQVTYGDSGGASRFFYVGKASKKERGEGNNHPCVKPLALMEYLLKLCSTPTGGVVLDPFAGSGTTLVAARRLGRSCIGIELEEHNCEIAKARISQAALQISS